MSIGKICVREVDLADRTESVQVAAERMNERNVGTLLVQDESLRPIGILTDRDLAVRVVAHGRDAYQTAVEEVMTECLTTVGEETSIEETLAKMRGGPYRRLPVVDGAGRLVGLVSLDDILELLSEEFQEIGQLIQGEGPASLGKL